MENPIRSDDSNSQLSEKLRKNELRCLSSGVPTQIRFERDREELMAMHAFIHMYSDHHPERHVRDATINNSYAQ